MTPEDELKQIENELRARGVKAVYVTFSPNVDSLTLEEVQRGTVAFFRAALDGRYRPIDKIGDAPRVIC